MWKQPFIPTLFSLNDPCGKFSHTPNASPLSPGVNPNARKPTGGSAANDVRPGLEKPDFAKFKSKFFVDDDLRNYPTTRVALLKVASLWSAL